MDLQAFKNLIKAERIQRTLAPFDLAYQSLETLGFTKKDKNYFMGNASHIVEQLRKQCWESFLSDEKAFSAYMYKQLIDAHKISAMSKEEAITWFIEEHTDHIYTLSLSNTQSRRARAGNEFEAIIEFLLMGAEIPFDSQGSIGSGVFESQHLAKLVDCVSPGASEYKLDKRNTSLISAKTTLRERWQEVGDEMSRTKAREMYLATLDEGLSDNVIDLIGKNNIILVTTKNNKNTSYSNKSNVITFEKMLEELESKASAWKSFDYSDENIEDKKKRLMSQLSKYEDKPFIHNYYENQISKI